MSFDPFDSLRMMAMGARQERSNAFRDEWDKIIVDTVIAFDTGRWETGVSKSEGEHWTIVEQYDDEDEANKGHTKWVKVMRDDPNTKLEDKLWGYGEDDE